MAVNRNSFPVALLLTIVLVSSPALASGKANSITAFQSAQGEEFATVWSAVLTPGETTETGPNGFCRAADSGLCIKKHQHGWHDPYGSLTDGTVEIDQTVHIVQSLRYGAANQDGKLHLTLDPPLSPDDKARLVLQIGNRSFSLSSAFTEFLDIGGNYVWIGFEEPWEVGDPIQVSLKKPPVGYAGHTPGTANTDLGLGVSMLSRLETADDRDWYRVDLEIAVSYLFQVRGPRPADTHLDWYQLYLDTSGSSHLVTRGPQNDAGSLRIVLYDDMGEAVWRDGSPVAEDSKTGEYRAGLYYQPTSGGAHYLEVTSPSDRPLNWYMVGYWEREPGNQP